MRPVVPYVTAALLFGLGVYGVLRRRNAVLVLMAVELMLNAVNLILVTADTTVQARLPHSGQVFALFLIVLAAAEIGVGLAIVLQLYRLRASVTVDDVPLTEPEMAAAPTGGRSAATTASAAGPTGAPSVRAAGETPEVER